MTDRPSWQTPDHHDQPNYGYGSHQPGPYPAPPTPPRPAPKRMPRWGKVLLWVAAVPVALIGGCTAIVAGSGLAQQAADNAPVISTAEPTYDPGIQTPPTESPAPKATPRAPKPVEQAPAYVPEDGTLLVGKDVKPGTYQTRVVEGDIISSCYWARLDANDEILDNDLKTTVGARMTVTVRASDYALEINCSGAVWKRVR